MREGVDVFAVDVLCFGYEGRAVLASGVALFQAEEFESCGGLGC